MKAHFPCLDCTRKHEGTAQEYAFETFAGYPLHRWKAAAQLYHAEQECASVIPELAQIIRSEYRLPIMTSYASALTVNFDPLLWLTCLLAGEDDTIVYATKGSKFWHLPQKYLDLVAKYQPEIAKLYVDKFGQPDN